jgi:cell division protein FtsN
MPDALMGEPFLLQSGAFEQRESAEREMARQQLIGLQVSIKQQELVGRTLFLLQSGPYPTSGLLSEAERLLRQSGIPHIRLKQQ